MKQNNKENSRLIEETNKAIAELVYPKWDLQKAYNYYNGKRDAEQYRYLEENFGIGQPTSVEFIPLIKKHIDALVGEYLGTPIIPKVSCKDSETITNIFREKELEISKGVFEFLQSHLQNSILQFIDGKTITDKSIEQQLNNLIQDLDYNFVSKYEIAAQDVIEYIMQSRNTDMLTKLKILILDLLITGYNFYRTKPNSTKTDVEIEVLSPLNTFFDKNPESPYIKDSYRVVVRKWLTKTQILNIYGKEMSKEDLEKIKELWRDSFDTSTYYIRSFSRGNGEPQTDGLNAGREVVPGYPTGPYNTYNYKLIPVYEVEWIETDSDFVMQRYETVRIGENIYILRGKNDKVIRSKDDPTHCTLSVNGVYFVNRGAEPYSLVLACANLQDKYDLLHFYRDNLIASSGTVGDWIDIAMIPASLGVKLPERLQKWQAYGKQGMKLIDTSQEGRLAAGQAPINTIFNGYDDTVKAQAIQAIQIAIDSVEQTTSSITGVFRERLGSIQQKDAVTNVQVSVNNSYTITKQYYQQMDLVTTEILIDSLNQAKIVFNKGLKGNIILGDKYQRIFVALPENFTVTDYDIRISTSTDIIKDMETIKAVIPDFIKSGTLDPGIILEALTTKSLTDLKSKVQKAIKIQKQENNQLQQLSQQVEQLQQQLQQAQQELQKAQSKVAQLDESKLALEREKLRMSTQLEWYKAQTDRNFKNTSAQNDTKRTEIEYIQLYDGNPYNDKIKQV